MPPSACCGSGERSACPLESPEAGGSEDGNESALASSGSGLPSFGSSTSSGSRSSSASRKAALDSVSETRSCGRFGPGERRHDVAEVELERVRVRRLLGVLVVPQALLLGVGLDERHALLRPAGELEVAQRLGVDREDRAGRAELRRHVADRGPVGQRQRRDAGAVELDEHPHDAALAQHLGHGQHEVGGGRALGQLARELEAEHLRHQHRHRLAEHRGLGLDAADAPAEHAEAVDHRRVRVRPDQRVGVGLLGALVRRLVAREDHAREVLEVDLVDDPGVGRDDGEVVEGALAPAQEGVALLVALELALGVDAEGLAGAEGVDLHRVVDHELGGDERVDLGGVAAEVGHRVAHRGEVDDRGHAGEVLHHDARGREGDLLGRLGVRVPAAPAPRCPPSRPTRRPRCAAGSRAAPSARRAAAPRRTSTAARRAGRSRRSCRRPRGRRGHRTNSLTCPAD